MKKQKLKEYYEQLDIVECCRLCEHAQAIYSDIDCLCNLHGVVDQKYHCKHFTYDLTKRMPHRKSRDLSALTDQLQKAATNELN